MALAFCGSGTFAQQSQDREAFESSQRGRFRSIDDVSLPASFKLAPGERLERFRCLVLSGVVQRIYTPYEWDMKIDNSSSAVGARTEVKANFAVDVAAFTNDGLGYFNDFMTVAWVKEEGPPRITVELSIETDDGLIKKLKFDNKQLVLRPTNRPWHPF